MSLVCHCPGDAQPYHVRDVCWAGDTDSAHEWLLWDWMEVLEHPGMARDGTCCQ